MRLSVAAEPTADKTSGGIIRTVITDYLYAFKNVFKEKVSYA
jgi:hypothetical protein